jgi:hypothetical protein
MTENNNKDITTLKAELEESISVTSQVYQITKSSEIKNNISTLLQLLNQEAYSYVLDIKNYIRNNVKDASSLKKALIEKIQANMGD